MIGMMEVQTKLCCVTSNADCDDKIMSEYCVYVALHAPQSAAQGIGSYKLPDGFMARCFPSLSITRDTFGNCISGIALKTMRH